MGSSANLIVGAYVTSPTLFDWDAEKETEYLSALKKQLAPIRGLELPFFGSGVHPHDSELFLSLLDKDWEYVLTCLPGTMKALENNAHFGLASDNESGRQAALDFYKRASLAIQEINTYFSANKVISVAIATSPSLNVAGVSSSVESLEKSLSEINEYDWGGAKLLIEHCDSGRVDNPVKGFLSLDEEIQAVSNINSKFGADIKIVINWARSVIEYRSIDGPVQHIGELKKSNLLGGLMFSGTGNTESLYGVWSDLHMPIAKEPGISYFEEASLMTRDNIARCLNLIEPDDLDYLGIKVLSMPIKESTLKRRIGINLDTMSVINELIEGQQ